METDAIGFIHLTATIVITATATVATTVDLVVAEATKAKAPAVTAAGVEAEAEAFPAAVLRPPSHRARAIAGAVIRTRMCLALVLLPALAPDPILDPDLRRQRNPP